MKSHPFDRLSAAFAILVLTTGTVLALQQGGVWAPKPPAMIAVGVCSLAVAVIVGWPRRRYDDPLTTDTPGQAINRITSQDS